MGGENKEVNSKNKLKSFLRRYYQQKVPLDRYLGMARLFAVTFLFLAFIFGVLFPPFK